MIKRFSILRYTSLTSIYLSLSLILNLIRKIVSIVIQFHPPLEKDGSEYGTPCTGGGAGRVEKKC